MTPLDEALLQARRSDSGASIAAHLDYGNLRGIAFSGRFLPLNEARNRGPAPHLPRKIERIGPPKVKPCFAMEMPDSVLAQPSR